MSESWRLRAARMVARARTTRVWRTFQRFTAAGGNVLAAGLSYQALFAVFAALWLGSGALMLVAGRDPKLVTAVAHIINAQVPGLIAVDGSEGAVDTAALLSSRALSFGSIAAGVVLLWAAGSWFTSARRALRLTYGLPAAEKGSALLLKLRDLGLVLVFSVLVVVSAVITVLGSGLLASVREWASEFAGSWLVGTAGFVLRSGAMLLADMLALFVLVRLLADVRAPWPVMWRGCVLGACALTLLKTLGGAVLGGGGSNPLLAGFAVLVGLLVWFNLLCRALLLTVAWMAVPAKLG